MQEDITVQTEVIDDVVVSTSANEADGSGRDHR